MKYSSITRRYFLQGLGGATLSLPLLPSLLPRAQAAQLPNQDIRFITAWHGNGNIPSRFFPNNIPMQNFSGGTKGTLTAVNTPVSEILSTQFNNLKSKMIVISGLRLQGHGHNPAVTLGGHGRLDEYGFDQFTDNSFLPFPSIDQIMAKSSAVYPTAPFVRSLHLKAVRAGNRFVGDRPDSVSYTASGNNLIQIPHERDPMIIFNLLFGTALNVDTAKTQKNKKVMDLVLEDYKSLLGNRRLSTQDKPVIEEHINHVDEMNERMVQLLQGRDPKNIPKTPNLTMDIPITQLSEFMSIHIDLLAAAIKSNQTKIATIMLSRVTDLDTYSFLPNAQNHSFHAETHAAGDSPYLVSIYRYFASKVAELATKLDVIENSTTGSTYLDNSILYFGNCMGVGISHTLYDFPVVILGSGGGFLKTNQFLRYSQTRYNQLLVTFLQALGLKQSEYQFNNQIGYGEYQGASPSNSPLADIVA